MSEEDEVSEAKYEEMPELKTLASKLKKKFPRVFGHVDINRVLFVKFVADRGFGRAMARCTRITEPITFLTPVRFVIAVKGSKYEKLGNAQRAILVMHEMLHIDTFDPPTIRRHDIEDFAALLKKYGIDWPMNADTADPLA